LGTVFHLLIIAVFVLSLNGCGYKKAPYYQEEAPEGDKNIEFIIKDQSVK
jgi:predicted small lipoprotein YifL